MKFSHIPILIAILPLTTFAAGGDLALPDSNVRFSTETFLEGKNIRIYATATNGSDRDLRGVIRFFTSGEQISGDQPISVIAGRDDSVFVDFKPAPGDHNIKITLVPFDEEGDDQSNNTVEKKITVLADTDWDGTPNRDDADDDNDGTPDDKDAFPLNKNESLDSDGDTIGNNKDDDDDNDGIKDEQDAVPLNAGETEDTDKDGIGNNADTDDDGDGIPDLEETKKGTDSLKVDTDSDKVPDGEDKYPLDPSQARDFDRDGTSDAKDQDADNDGITKTNDVNDTNLGPDISIKSNNKRLKRIVFPNEPVNFETTTSIDPDGSIVLTKWRVDGKEAETGPNLQTQFPEPGVHLIAVELTDDRGESREETFRVYVIPTYVPWLTIGLLMLIFILAIFFFFSYSSRRRLKKHS